MTGYHQNDCYSFETINKNVSLLYHLYIHIISVVRTDRTCVSHSIIFRFPTLYSDKMHFKSRISLSEAIYHGSIIIQRYDCFTDIMRIIEIGMKAYAVGNHKQYAHL